MSTNAQSSTVLWIDHGYSWRTARLVSVSRNQATVQDGDVERTVPLSKCRVSDNVMQPRSEWRTLDGAA